MRIAIIGSGVSGLAAAYIAAPHAQLTIYEADDRLGGHAHTHTIQHGEKTIRVDSGFMVCNPPQYPQFMALLKELGISPTPTEMQFSVEISGVISYSSKMFSGVFAEWRNLFRPSFYKFLYEILRFQRLARKMLSDNENTFVTESLGDFLTRNSFSTKFNEWHLLPMLGAIWSSPTKEIFSFPALSTFKFLNNHQLLSTFSKPHWHTIQGGSDTYVQRIENFLSTRKTTIHLSTPVRSITRSKKDVTITTDSGSETFDYCILATHADTALKLLADATPTEKDILGAFSYANNRAVLHSDQSMMPQNKRAWASWNYFAGSSTSDICVTYNMNTLQHIDTRYPVYVTLNSPREIPKEKVFADIHYTHPHFSVASYAAQQRVNEIQNQHRTLYCGAHWGYGFHEDGVVSAINALKSLTIHPTWSA